MKKTETMNVVMETNKMLREEKERLEQDLQQMQAKVAILLIENRGMFLFFII
jgi:nucleoprotein TPR